MSAILEQWLLGRGVPGVLVIDGHTHVGEWPHGTNFATAREAAEGAVGAMDACGVDAACVLGGGYMENGADYRTGNDFLLECVAYAPDRLIPFAHINPNDAKENLLGELRRMLDSDVHCIKLLNSYQGYPGDGPNLMALYAFCQEHGMLVLNHHWSEAELRTVSSAFPDGVFIRAHGGASGLSHELPNVYDNIWSLWPLARIEDGVQRFGADKVLLGSDAFMNDLSVGLGMVMFADIPDEDKRAILGLNMARLLERAGALPTGFGRWL